MKILTFTSLFPNREQPNSAIFIKHRMAAVHRREDAEVRVVAPVPYYPSLPFGGRWQAFSRVPYREAFDDFKVWHPRYLVTPKIGMTLYGYSMFLGSLLTVRKIFKEWPFDIIDAHYVYPDGLAALLLGRYFRRPVMVSARGTDINYYPQLRFVRPLIKRVLSSVDHLVSVCGSLADCMVDLGTDRSRITVIPNGIDSTCFFPRDRMYARKKIGIEPKIKLLLSVGALIERKGMHLLVDALALLKRQRALDFYTCIVGAGPERERLEHKIYHHNLSDAVSLVGEIDNSDLADWYYAADLFFLGSSREGWPNVVCESLACGTPVVATPVNGIPEIIASSDLGIIVDREPSQFAEAIQQGLSRAWDRSAIQKHGQSRTWDAVAKEVIEVAKNTVYRRPQARILRHDNSNN